LEPLAKGGTPLVVKIPLKGNTYLLVENRQPIGYDRVMPDSGILVLKINPDAIEGAGTVRIMDADPATPVVFKWTYKLDEVTV